jgi:hypothetical protein
MQVRSTHPRFGSALTVELVFVRGKNGEILRGERQWCVACRPHL